MKKVLILYALAISTYNHTMEEGLLVSTQDSFKENIKKHDHAALATFFKELKEKQPDEQKSTLESIDFDSLKKLAEKKAVQRFPLTSYIAWAGTAGMLYGYTYLGAQTFSNIAITCNQQKLDQETSTYHSYCPEAITNRLENEYYNWTFFNNVIVAGFGIGNLALFIALKQSRIPAEKTLQSIEELNKYKKELLEKQ